MNVALDRLPSFTALPGEGDHLSSGIILAPSLDYMDRAYLDARAQGWSREPVVEMLILHARRHAGACGKARRQPVLPARCS